MKMEVDPCTFKHAYILVHIPLTGSTISPGHFSEPGSTIPRALTYLAAKLYFMFVPLFTFLWKGTSTVLCGS
jgi:hypothetical protein